jgi:hypothetical protein
MKGQANDDQHSQEQSRGGRYDAASNFRLEGALPSVQHRRRTRPEKKREKRRQKPMKQKPKKTTKQEAESTDREHDEKHDLSFLNLPANAKENAEGFGEYKYNNYNN